MSKKKRPAMSERQLLRKQMLLKHNIEKMKPQTNSYVEQERTLRNLQMQGLIDYDEYNRILTRTNY